MTHGEKFERIKGCDSVKELELAIEEIAEFMEYKGEIGQFIPLSGNRYVSAKEMKERVKPCYQGNYPMNYLTRNFGIRQQLLYIMYYDDVLIHK